jgi:hypothetical protein
MPAVPGAGQVSRHPRRRPGRSSSLRCGRSAWTPTPVSHAQTRPGTAEKQTQPAQLDLTGPALSGMTGRCCMVVVRDRRCSRAGMGGAGASTEPRDEHGHECRREDCTARYADGGGVAHDVRHVHTESSPGVVSRPSPDGTTSVTGTDLYRKRGGVCEIRGIYSFSEARGAGVAIREVLVAGRAASPMVIGRTSPDRRRRTGRGRGTPIAGRPDPR